MKKALYILSAAAVVFASCDPVCEDKDFSFIALSDADFAKEEFITFKQTDKSGAAQADGNYFTYSTNPATIVDIYVIQADGSEKVLTKSPAAAGSFELSPSRGSDPNQTLYIRTIDPNQNVIKGTRNVTVAVASELPLQMKLLVADAGTKTWKWNLDGRTVWGNMGYCGGNGELAETNHEGQWWGVDFGAETFANQQQHRGTDIVTGDDDPNAYMVWKEDGSIECFNATGDKIRTGNFEMKEYDTTGLWKKGDLKTSQGAILWPYQINKDGRQPETFEVVYLSVDKMCLVNAEGNGDLGGWGEATYWHFASNSDGAGILGGYGEEGNKWGWNSDGRTVWGNMGYCGGDGSLAETNHEGQWWGVDFTSATFADQQQHRGGEAVTGDDDPDAYMIFSADGTIKSYNKDGGEIRNGTWAFEPVAGNTWKVGDLKTSKGAILWPYQINKDGNQPESFEVVYLSGDKMCLVNAEGNGDLGGWGEATYWHFEKK